MTITEYRKAMIPHWEAYMRVCSEAWSLYGTGFYNYRDRCRDAAQKYQATAAALWKEVVL